MYHKITILGNLGSDPELRFTPSGAGVATFSVAANRKYTNNTGAQVTETTWFRISAWGKLGELCTNYLSKGRQVFIEGSLTSDDNGSPRTFQRKDGSSGASYEVRADVVRFVGSRNDGDGERSAAFHQEEEEELPF